MTTHCNCDCDCNQNFTMVPVRGINLAIDNSVLGGEGIDYSFDEQWTGRLWVDGKKIYQKTINTGVLPNATVKKTPHGVFNIDNVVFMGGFATSSGFRISLPHPYPDTNCVALFIDNATTSFVVTTYHDCRHYTTSYVTIQYTCTDR